MAYESYLERFHRLRNARCTFTESEILAAQRDRISARKLAAFNDTIAALVAQDEERVSAAPARMPRIKNPENMTEQRWRFHADWIARFGQK